MQADIVGKYKGKSSMQVLQILYQSNGLKSLYRGFAPGASKFPRILFPWSLE
jgi:hypothetical protein